MRLAVVMNKDIVLSTKHQEFKGQACTSHFRHFYWQILVAGYWMLVADF